MLESKLNFAAIDIGSNAVRLLIKGIRPGETVNELTKCVMLRIPLRLGEDSFSDGRISTEKQKQLMRTIRAFRLLMKVFNVVSYRACATSAMRDAVNGGRIADRIYAKTGIRIEVIDGVEEARIVYDSHIGDLLESQGSYIYVDVGGGSTEVSLIHGGALISSRSYDVGTVRMLSGKVKERTWEMLRGDMDQLKNEYPGIQISDRVGISINCTVWLAKGTMPVSQFRSCDVGTICCVPSIRNSEWNDSNSTRTVPM